MGRTQGAEIRRTHQTVDISQWQGQASVRRGTSLRSRLLGWIFGFPTAGDHIPVEATKTVTDRGETWQRRFGTRVFHSHLAATDQGITERFGPFTFVLGMRVEHGALHFPVDAGRLGPLPLPRWLLPISEAKEYLKDGCFQFDVKLHAPLTGLVGSLYGHTGAFWTVRPGRIHCDQHVSIGCVYRNQRCVRQYARYQEAFLVWPAKYLRLNGQKARNACTRTLTTAHCSIYREEVQVMENAASNLRDMRRSSVLKHGTLPSIDC